MATGLPHPVEEGRSGVRERGWGASCREERVEEIPGHTRASLLPGGGGGVPVPVPVQVGVRRWDSGRSLSSALARVQELLPSRSWRRLLHGKLIHTEETPCV